jgi:dienelactone hydrolase
MKITLILISILSLPCMGAGSCGSGGGGGGGAGAAAVPAEEPEAAAEDTGLTRVRYTAAGAEVEAFYRHPGGDLHPGVIYNHGREVEMLGYEGAAAEGYDVADFVNALADAGYAAIAPIRPAVDPEYDTLREMIVGGIDYLLDRPNVDPERIFMIGFSKGGLLSFQAAVESDDALAGLVLMSPSPGSPQDGWDVWATTSNFQRIDVPVFATVGGAETGDIPHNVRAFVDAMQDLGKETAFREFDEPGAIHAWFHQVRDEYWLDILAWLADHE